MKDRNGLTEEEFLKQYNPDKYPKPSLTADIVVLAKGQDCLQILLVKRGGHPFIGHYATPGGFANKNEPLEKTAARELAEETGVTGLPLQLLGVYSKPGRDPRGWVVSCAYMAVIDKNKVNVKAGDDAAEAKWFTVTKAHALICGDETLSLSDLAFDHQDIVRDALAKIGY